MNRSGSKTDPRYPVLHAGMSQGRIWVSRGTGDAALIDEPGVKESEFLRRDMEVNRHVGEPWVRLPGDPPDHKIVGTLASGKKVTAIMAGFCWNDAVLIDEACGRGTYERVMPFEEVEILGIAKGLYSFPEAFEIERRIQEKHLKQHAEDCEVIQ